MFGFNFDLYLIQKKFNIVKTYLHYCELVFLMLHHTLICLKY